jgi:Rrf2 family protein
MLDTRAAMAIIPTIGMGYRKGQPVYLSQKCQYAFRAVFELARRHKGGRPVPVTEIAEAQAIPPRFLAQILANLREGKFVASHRGSQGGFTLTVPPSQLKVGDIIRFVEGPISPVPCVVAGEKSDCSLRANCVFMDFWNRARKAIEEVYDGTTFEDLVREVQEKATARCADYAI